MSIMSPISWRSAATSSFVTPRWTAATFFIVVRTDARARDLDGHVRVRAPPGGRLSRLGSRGDPAELLPPGGPRRVVVNARDRADPGGQGHPVPMPRFVRALG